MKKLILLLSFSFLFAFAEAQKGTLDDAWKSFYKNDRQKAIEQFEEAAENSSTAEDAHLALAILYADDGQPDKAFANFQKFYTETKNPYPYVDVLWYTAAVSYGTGYKDKARLKFYDKMLADPKVPGHIKAHIHSAKGDHFQDLGDFKKARAEFAQIGSVTSWMAAGEFENISASGFDKSYDPIANPSMDAKFRNKNGAAVEWFPLKEVRLDRWIDNEYYFYSGNSIIYSQTFANSPKDQDVQFRLGVSGSIKVWLNDQLILSEEEERNNGFDSYIIETRLSSGYNRILIQVGESEADNNNFMLRITDKNGDNIEGLTYTNNSSENYTKSEAKAERLKTYAIDYFEKLVADEPSFINHILLAQAYLNLDMSFESRTMLKKAEKIAPTCTYVQLKLVNIYQRDNNRTAIAKTIEWLKEHDKSNPLTLGLLYDEAMDNEDYNKADSILTELEDILGENNEDNFEKRMSLLAAQDETEALIGKIDKGYDLYPENYFFVNFKVILLNAKKESGAAIKVLKKYLKKNYNLTATRQLANMYLNNGKVQDGLSLLEKIVTDDPIAIGYLSTLADIYVQLGNYKKGIELMDRALEIAPYVGSYWAVRAKCYSEMNDDDQAKEDYGRCILLNPTDFDSRRKLRELNGNKEDIFSKFDKIDVYQAFKEAGPASDYPDDNSAILVNAIQRVVYSDGVSEEKHILVVKVFNSAGIDIWKEYSVGGYSTQRVVIEKVEVLKANGSKFEAERSGGRIVFTNLEAGDGIHVTYRIENYQRGKLAQHFSDQHYFDLFYPVKLSSYSLLINPEIKFKHSFSAGGFEPKKTSVGDGFDLYVWEKKDIAPLRSEPFMPEIVDFGEVLFISTLPDWKFVSNWYSDLAKTKARSDFEVKEAAQEIFAGKENLPEVEKVKLIHEYIVKNIRYSLVPFRQGGLIPQKASKVINTRVGDCKDVSTLFVALCREGGIDSARLVLINTRDNGKNSQLLPSIDFNHCIGAVTIEGKEYYVELTSDKIGFTSYPLNLNKAYSLKIFDENENVTPQPSYLTSTTKIEDNIIRTTSVTISGKEMIIDKKSVKTGDWATDMRNTYDDIPESERKKQLLRSITGDNASVTLNTYAFHSLNTISDSFRYDYNYTTGNAVTQITGLNIFSIPWTEKMTSIGFMSSEERKYPINFWDRYQFDVTKENITITMPSGKVLAEMPKNVSISCSAATYKVTYKVAGNKLEAMREMRIKTDVVTPAQYAEVKKFFEKVVEEDTRQLAFK